MDILNRKPRVFGYIRASTDKQELTLMNQRQRIEQRFQSTTGPGDVREGYAWGGVYEDDDVSGRTRWFARPSGELMFRELERGDHIIVWKLSRACRSMADFCGCLEILKEAGVTIESIHENVDMSTPLGRFMMHIIGAFNEMEVETIKMQTKEGLDYKRRNGLPFGGKSPIGWRKEGLRKQSRFVPDHAERRLALTVANLRDGHKRSFKSIAREFAKAGYPTRQGGEWEVVTVMSLYTAAKFDFPTSITFGNMYVGYCYLRRNDLPITKENLPIVEARLEEIRRIRSQGRRVVESTEPPPISASEELRQAKKRKRLERMNRKLGLASAQD